MKNRFKQLLTVTLCCLPFSADAYNVVIDEFFIIKNGSTVFQDEFADGTPPPSATNSVNGNFIEDAYVMLGTMGPELDMLSANKLVIDSSGAAQTLGPTGDPFFVQLARRKTNINPDTPDLGLRSDDIFLVNATFDLSLPAAQREAYGVRLNDVAPGSTPDDIVELMVIRNISDELEVQFRHLDFVAGTSTLIDKLALETGHDQIMLSLFKGEAESNAISAQVGYIDNGTAGQATVLDTTFDIFSNEDFTRGEFLARTPVPVPAAVWLFGSGLLGLVGVARSKENLVAAHTGARLRRS